MSAAARDLDHRIAGDHDVPVWGETYTCVWEDGHTTTHSTPLDPRRDLKIIIEED